MQTTTVDLSFWLQLALAIASASVPVFLAFIAAWAKQHFKVAKDSAMSATIDLAVTAGQQFVAGAIAKAPTEAAVNTKNVALAGFLNSLSAGTIAAMDARGTTKATVAQRIEGALTNALNLALVPGVTVAPLTTAAPAAVTQTPTPTGA
jgi:hypothetical protein